MKKAALTILTLFVLIILVPTTACANGLPTDGQYTVEVTLTGGSGRASVESPAELKVVDGDATAVIIWSSPFYEYMLIDGVSYYPINDDGNATFEIPVTFDEYVSVSALTVAMSQPHEIDYSLYFDSRSLEPLGAQGNNTSLVWIAVGVVAVIIARAVALLSKTALKRRKEKH